MAFRSSGRKGKLVNDMRAFYQFPLVDANCAKMVLMNDAQSRVDEGRRLFNEGQFWHVHEVLETLWKARQGKEKDLLQGLILIAASLVHAQKNEMDVSWSILARALPKLEGQPDAYYGWDVKKFQDHFARVLAAKNLEIPTV